MTPRTPHRALAAWRTRLPAAALALALATGCGGDDGPSGRDEPTAVDLTEEGWAAFSAGAYADALEAFERAVTLVAGHGPAYLGAAWTLLAGGLDDDDLATAAARFSDAAAAGETGAEMLGGRAAARLALGGSDLPGAAADAAAAVIAEPGFVFDRRPSFAAADLHLIVAQAEAARGRYGAALAAADAVAPSGIDAADEDTWIVAGEACETFARAVLARLEQLSDAECVEVGEETAR